MFFYPQSTYFLIRFFVFFEKKQVFVLFEKKHKNPILNCFHCIMHHHFQKYITITCYTNMAFKFKGKEMYPIFVFAKCFWSIHSEGVRLGKNAHSKQRKATPTQIPQFHIKFIFMPY